MHDATPTTGNRNRCAVCGEPIRPVSHTDKYRHDAELAEQIARDDAARAAYITDVAEPLGPSSD